MQNHNPKITDIERRISNQVFIGQISQADYKKARYRVKFAAIETDWIADCQARSGQTKTWEGRDIGEQVIAICPSGDLAQAVIVGSIHTDKTQAGDKVSLHRIIYPDGSMIDYDDATHAYNLSIKNAGSFSLNIEAGVAISAKGGKLIISAPEGIELQSPRFLHAGKDIGANHVHSGVKSGSSFTGEPK